MSQDLILARWFDWDMPATAAPAGPITGSAGLTFGQSGTLQGLTQLTGTAGLTFGQSGTTQGLTALTGSNGLTFGQTGTLSGSTALTGTAQITLGQSGSATGNTALTGTAQITFGQSGTLDPVNGDISGTAGITFGQSAALQGLTALTGTGSLTFAASGTLDQPGAITGTAGLSFGQNGTLQGLTALNGSASITFGATGAVDQPQGSGPTQPTPAGGSVLYRRKRRMFIEIDGQQFDVESAEHAQALLDQVKALAQRVAPQQAERKLTVHLERNPRVRPKIERPHIVTHSPELHAIVRQARQIVSETYKAAYRDAEIRLRMAQKIEMDDGDDEDLLMLL